MTVFIRQGTAEDTRASYELVRALAVHENCVDDLKIDAQGFSAAATANPPRLHFMVAELDGQIVGVATYVERYHIWHDSIFLNLDDLYVSPAARGHGIGTKLLAALGSTAKARGLPVKWEVMKDNEDAIRLYERMGARVSLKGVCWWTPENIAD